MIQPQTTVTRSCRFCSAELRQTFVDLGMSPLCETYPSAEELNRGEIYYPLHAYVCTECFLVQLDEYVSGENIFSNYPYFSSYSDSWLQHCERYCKNVTERFGLNDKSFVVEVASNDGYLLQYLVRQNIPVLGIEPAANVAAAAVEKNVPTLVSFFGRQLARELVCKRQAADLVVANNVLAQVPDLNDFVAGLSILVKAEGVLTLEFPHVLRLIQQNEFDTIYHEHFSYFSMLTVSRILEAHGMRAFDVEELPTHGGSLRIYACHVDSRQHQPRETVPEVITAEQAAGLNTSKGYAGFRDQVKQTKLALVRFLAEAAVKGKSVAGYGAPGKSATLLQYCGIGKDLIQYTVDRNPHKQGRFLPGSHIPIHHPDHIAQTKPDYVVILPWNLKDEIMQQLELIREWGGQFVVPIPTVEVC